MTTSHQTPIETITQGKIDLLQDAASMQYLVLAESEPNGCYIDVMQGRLCVDTVHYRDIKGWLDGYSALFAKRIQ